MAGSDTTKKVLNCSDYTIGWICATPRELAVSTLMLDEVHSDVAVGLVYDGNSYRLGRVHHHNVAVTCLPGFPGTNAAEIVIRRMASALPRIEVFLMIGTGGGAPSISRDIRLGDVVVSMPNDHSNGVNRYELRVTRNEEYYYQRAGSLGKPPQSIATALSRLQADNYITPLSFIRLVQSMLERNPNMRLGFSKPSDLEDNLFQPHYEHANAEAKTCIHCDKSRLVPRAVRLLSVPLLHFGIVGCMVDEIDDPSTRDLIMQKDDVLCFDTEAAGLPTGFPCVLIRGIADYADSHRNDQWKGYAAANAVALSKEILRRLPSETALTAATEPIKESEKPHDGDSAFENSSGTPDLTPTAGIFPQHGTQPTKANGSAQSTIGQPSSPLPLQDQKTGADETTPKHSPGWDLSTWVMLGGLQSPARQPFSGTLSKRSNSLRDELIELDAQVRAGNRHNVARFAKKFVVDFKSPVHPRKLCVRLMQELETNLARGNKLLGDEQGYTPLHHLSTLWSDDCEEEMALFLEGGINIEAQASICCDGDKPRESITALWLAARFDNTSAVRCLLKSGARLESASKEEATPLHIACIERSRETVKMLLQSGASVFAIDDFKDTPLLAASRLSFSEKTWEIVHLLLRHGAEVNARNNMGRTALHYAAIDSDIKSLRQLLAYEASITMKDEEGHTPLYYCLAKVDTPTKKGMVSLLKSSYEERSDLYSMLPDHIMTLIKEQRYLEAQYLVQEFGPRELSREGVLVDVRDSKNSPYLILAAHAGSTDLVQSLIDAKANWFAVNNNGNTALHLAAAAGHADVVDILLQVPEDCSIVNRAGNTALHLAASKGHTKIVQALLGAPGNHMIANKAGDTALMVAVAKKHADATRLLIASTTTFESPNNDGMTVLFIAIRHSSVDIVRALIRAGADFRGSEFEGKTTLVYAIEQRRDEIASCLIQEGIKARDNEYNTLHAAIDNDLPMTVEALLEKGIFSFMVRDRRSGRSPSRGGKTSLRQATGKGHLEVVKTLLKYSANVNPDDDDDPPLCIAVANSFIEIVEELFNSGAYINSRDKSDRTPLMIAAENNDIEMIHLLLNRRADPDLRRSQRTAADLATTNECRNILRAAEST